MHRDHMWKNAIGQLRRSMFKRRVIHLIGRMALISAFFLYSYRLMIFFGAPPELIPWLMIFFLMIFIVTVMLFFKKHWHTIDYLKDLDKRLGLKDLLTSAHEFSSRPEKHPYISKLLDQAADLLGNISFKKLYPLDIKVDGLIILLIILFSILFPFKDLQRIFFSEIQKKEQYSTYHPATGKSSIEEEKYAQRASTPGFVKPDTMAPFNRKLKKKRIGPLPSDETDPFASLLDQKQSRVLKELSESLLKTGFYYDAVLPMMGDVSSGKTDPNQLKTIIEKAYEGKIPKEVADGLSLLSDLMEDTQNMEGPLTGETRMDENRSLEPGDSRPKMHQRFEDKNITEKKEQPDNKEREGRDQSNSASSIPESEKIGDRAEKDNEKAAHKSSTPHQAGNLKAEIKEPAAQSILKPEGEVFKSFGEETKNEKTYGMRITSNAPAHPFSPYPVTNDKTFREEKEHVISKEGLPINYINYIKTYFILIGMEEE